MDNDAIDKELVLSTSYKIKKNGVIVTINARVGEEPISGLQNDFIDENGKSIQTKEIKPGIYKIIDDL
jgi:hypothetical protein